MPSQKQQLTVAIKLNDQFSAGMDQIEKKVTKFDKTKGNE